MKQLLLATDLGSETDWAFERAIKLMTTLKASLRIVPCLNIV